jgi:hypothetical protein
MLPIPPEHQALVARYIRFVECKAPGKPARGQQTLRHQELRALGFHVHTIDTLLGAEVFIRDIGVMR